MSFGIGIDVEEVARVRRLLKNKRFLNRIFTPQEIAYCSSKKNKAQHFAVRFAAKEAVWKAISETLMRTRKRVSHKDIGVRNSKHGKPEVVLPAPLRAMQKKMSLSLSHTQATAVAVALLRR